MQRLVHGGQQQRQRAAAGAVGHDDAHAAAVEVLRGQGLRDELPDRVVGQDLVGTADPGGAAGEFGDDVKGVGHSCTLPRPVGFGKRPGQQMATDCPAGQAGNSERMPAESAPLTLHPARLLPADPGVRGIARRLYEAVRDLPIISPHGHVDPRLLLEDKPFADPTSLLLQPDHYVTRLLHANGVSLADLGVGEGPLPEPRPGRRGGCCARTGGCCAAPRCGTGSTASWATSSASPSGRARTTPTRSTTRSAPSWPSRRLPARARCSTRFGIDVLATTDDPADDLAAHAAIARTRRSPTRVIPTFRPDRYLEPAGPAGSTRSRGSARRRRSTSGSTPDTSRRWRSAAGSSSPAARPRPTTAMPTRHASRWNRPRRNASTACAMNGPGHRRRGHRVPPAHGAGDGPDVLRGRPGDDPAPGGAPQSPPGHLRPVRRGHRPRHPGRAWSSPRRCSRCWSGTAPTRTCTWCCSPWTPTCSAGRSPRWPGSTRPCTPAPRGGSWTTRPRSARSSESVTEIAGLTRLSGFIDDTRAFCSIPARHDMSRRLDAGFLAGLVAEHRLDEDEALDSVVDLVADQPRKVFKL